MKTRQRGVKKARCGRKEIVTTGESGTGEDSGGWVGLFLAVEPSAGTTSGEPTALQNAVRRPETDQRVPQSFSSPDPMP
jgi:hypothetical protein